MSEKRIEVVDLRIRELADKIGNPRKISKKKKEELRESFEQFGDFGIIVVDEENNIISGHQRVEAIRDLYGYDGVVHCKRLIGYSLPELKAINIKANTHAGEWDMDKLAEWTADLQVNLGLDLPEIDAVDRKVKDMELIRYEKYDYVLIACRNEVDYLNLIRALGLEDKKIIISKTAKNTRKIKARAIWYDEMRAKIVPLNEADDD